MVWALLVLPLGLRLSFSIPLLQLVSSVHGGPLVTDTQKARPDGGLEQETLEPLPRAVDVLQKLFCFLRISVQSVTLFH